MDEYHKHRKDCQFAFAPLDVCDCVQKNMADRIEALEQDFKAVLRREEGFHRAAMDHLRDLEQERIKSKNYAAFSHEWRERCEALEAQVRAADALAEAHLAIVETTEGLPGTTIQECRQISRKALAAYRSATESSEK